MTEKEEFVRQFREVQPKFSRFYARLLARANLSFPQYALMNQLLNRGEVSMTEISAKLQISKPAVTSLVDRLEKNKLLKRISHPKDRRISLLQIQPKGEKIVREAQADVLHFLLKTFEALSAGERRTITRFYRLLSQTLDRPPALGKRRYR